MDRCSHPLLALAFAVLLPSLAFGEAREPDRIATTAGYSSSIQMIDGSAALKDARLEVWLRGDHATLRARYRITRTA